MSCLRCLCLFACSGAQRISCCIFVLYFFVFVYHMLPGSLDCPFRLSIRCTLMFILTTSLAARMLARSPILVSNIKVPMQHHKAEVRNICPGFPTFHGSITVSDY